MRNSRVRRAVFAGAMLAGGQFVTLTYIQLFLVEDLGTTLHFAAVVLVLTQVAGFVGRLVWGVVSDFAFDGRRREVLLAILLLAAGGAIGMSFADESTTVSVAIPMAIVLGFTTVGSPGIYIALISDLSPARARHRDDGRRDHGHPVLGDRRSAGVRRPRRRDRLLPCSAGSSWPG